MLKSYKIRNADESDEIEINISEKPQNVKMNPDIFISNSVIHELFTYYIGQTKQLNRWMRLVKTIRSGELCNVYQGEFRYVPAILKEVDISLPLVVRCMLPGNSGAVNEAFVSINISRLRKYIPNFVYTFSAILCKISTKSIEKSIDQYSDETRGLCKGRNQSIVLIQEFVSGCSFHESVKYMGEDDILSVIIQVMMALQFAQDKFEFNHFDLHGSNVFVVFRSEGKSIEYDEKIKTFMKYMPVIMDVDRSRIRNSPGIMSSTWDYIPDEFVPMADVWSFMMSSFMSVYTYAFRYIADVNSKLHRFYKAFFDA
jgi:hypothetical protein